jgi:predicted helicase
VNSNFILTLPIQAYRSLKEDKPQINCSSKEEKQRKKEKEKNCKNRISRKLPQTLQKRKKRIQSNKQFLKEGVGATVYMILGLESPIAIILCPKKKREQRQ